MDSSTLAGSSLIQLNLNGGNVMLTDIQAKNSFMANFISIEKADRVETSGSLAFTNVSNDNYGIVYVNGLLKLTSCKVVLINSITVSYSRLLNAHAILMDTVTSATITYDTFNTVKLD